MPEDGTKRLKSCVKEKCRTNVLLTQINFMRIYCPPYLLPQVAGYAATLKDDELLLPLLEALGWHRQAYTSAQVLPVVEKLMKDTSHSEQVRQEALKTYKRLK